MTKTVKRNVQNNQILRKLAKIKFYQKKLQKLNIGIVYLYGSYSQNIASNLSDLDIGVVVNKPIKNVDQKINIYSQMEQIIYSLLDKFPNEMQIVILNNTSVIFQYQAVKHAKVLYEESTQDRLFYEENILNNYLDFQPLYHDFLKTRLEAHYV